MCVWDNLAARATGKRKHAGADGPLPYIYISAPEAAPWHDPHFGEYKIEARLASVFYVDEKVPLNLDQKTTQARRALAELLYEDVLQPLDEIARLLNQARTLRTRDPIDRTLREAVNRLIRLREYMLDPPATCRPADPYDDTKTGSTSE